MPVNSARWRLVIFLYLSLTFAGSAACLLFLLSGGLEDPASASLTAVRPYLFYISAGSLGGSLYALRAFHQFYEQPVTIRFVYWYFMRPYLCGGTAMITIILLDSGIMLLSVENSLSARTGLAFLTGFGYGKFMEKLTHLAEALFNGNGNGKKE
jgi:hypothetical protein